VSKARERFVANAAPTIYLRTTQGAWVNVDAIAVIEPRAYRDPGYDGSAIWHTGGDFTLDDRDPDAIIAELGDLARRYADAHERP
jgi:hypothetical protein